MLAWLPVRPRGPVSRAGPWLRQRESVVRPDLGHVVAFGGGVRHGGAPVTRGVRYIIAAFLWVSEEGE